MTTRYPRNFGWRFVLGDSSDYADPQFDDTDWQEVDIPHSMVELPFQYFDDTMATTVGWYRKHIDISECEGGHRKFLRFEAVATNASVYIEGLAAGTHQGAFTPFEIEIPSQFRDHETIMVALRCDAAESPDIPPFGHVVDFLVPGGMYREVSVIARPEYAIGDVFVSSKPKGRPTDRSVQLRYELSTVPQFPEDLSIQASIVSAEGHLLTTYGESLVVPCATLQMDVDDVVLWDLDNPVLYTVETTLLQHGKPIDVHRVNTGFRDFGFFPDGFLLNGRSVKLRGLNRHQSYPYVGYAMPKSQQYSDAQFLKDTLGVHIVRTSHYPQSPHFLDKCDELGLLVFTELPGWQHVGTSESWRASACRQLQELIVRDRNHPSVVLWGVRINESPDDNDLYARTNELAKWLDPSRPTGGVRNFAHSTLLEDVYTYNDFSHNGTGPALAKPKRIAGGKRVPYLVTEHNGHMFPTRPGDPEGIRTEHALRHARVLDAMYADTRTSGAIGWCMSDYHTHHHFGGGDQICWHGVADMFRIPKLAASVYASQQDGYPVMEISSQLAIGAHPGHAIGTVWVFTNCDSVELRFRGELVGTYRPDPKRFPHLPHPPIPVDDLIGKRLYALKGFTEKELVLLGDVLTRAARGNFSFPLMKKLALGLLMRKHRLGREDAVNLFERFVLSWDGQESMWEFLGYKDGEIVCGTRLQPVRKAILHCVADTDTLHADETYDVVRCVASLRSETGQLLW
ncbi:MAG TPA: beta-galactosidase, partial [Sphaerochaeta sp.]|nr:beta-galactosidase [Sphaerochaeta sp.]